jgi:hypothetical protein
MSRILAERIHVNGTEMTWEWWQDNIVNWISKLCVTCTVCNKKCTPTITFFIQGGLGCDCRYKTEGKLAAWLEDVENCVVRRQYPKAQNPDTERESLPFDFFITKREVFKSFKFIIELDGEHHFTGLYRRTHETLTPQNDLVKEKWAIEQGYSVIRLHQPDVWFDNTKVWNWQNFIHESITQIRKSAVAKVYTPDIPQYRSGLYAELRA